MLNGRNHPAAGKNIAVNGRGNQAAADAESSALYGEYEQKLASELAELLKAGGSLPSAAARALPQSPSELYEPVDLPRIASQQTALQQAAPGREKAFVQAPRPQNDFARSGKSDEPPLAFSWRHEPRPAQPSWFARQMRSAVFGLGVGLIIVLPGVAVLSGRFDAWLPVQKQSAAADRTSRVERTAMPQRYAPPSSPIVAATVKTIEVRSQADTAPLSSAVAPSSSEAAEASASQPQVAAAPSAPSLHLATPRPVEPAASAARVKAPVAAPAVTDEAADLLAVGLKLLNDGDIAGARIPLTKAANIGNAEAMFALGETFDPNMLAAWGARDVKSDASTARLFYGRAVAAGLTKAKLRLEALN